MVKELIYEVNYQSSARPRGPYKSYYPLGFYPHTKVRLGVSKKVLKVLVGIWTSKLEHLKFFDLPLYKGKCCQKTLRWCNFGVQ